MINPADAIRDIWKKCFDLHIDPQLVIPLGGGSINHVFKVVLPDETVVLKVNSAEQYPGMFTAEERGLNLLRKANVPPIPEVICTTTMGRYQYLVLEYLAPAPRKKNFFEDFGHRLANLHRQSAATYGLDHDNYIGALPQYNHAHAELVPFLIHQRFEPQLKMALRNKHLNNTDMNRFELLFNRLHDLLPDEPPALIHGDLWSGNYLTGPDGIACLIDPAVSYSHREADLAMSRLFGGFDVAFYDAYHAAYPLQPGFEQRADIWNLYPLLVHVNLFGGNYIQEVRSVLASVIV